jgi:F0F1-type ATP synthase membrane subunit b/b'
MLTIIIGGIIAVGFIWILVKLFKSTKQKIDERQEHINEALKRSRNPDESDIKSCKEDE